MSDKETGGPAFPGVDEIGEPYSGMTLRDYFAGLAMKIVPPMSAYNMQPNETHPHYIARKAYEYADAMLEARNAN